MPQHRGGPRPVRPLGRGHRARCCAATAGCGRPRWAKLSPNVSHLPEIAAAAREAGAEAVTLVNTVMGMAIDPEARRFRLGSGPRGGGLSGPAIHPVAVRAVFDVHAARCPTCRSSGVGGVASGGDAAELLLAGATGGAGRARPRSPTRGRPAGCGTSWSGGRCARACRASGT